MELEANKELVMRFGEVVNSADWDALDDILTEDLCRHSQATPGVKVTSLEEFKALQRSFLVGFPDQRVTIEKMVAEGDHIAVYGMYKATHTGPMGETPATGKAVEVAMMTLFRVENGRIAEIWVEWDNMAMLTQLGLFPPTETTEG